MINLNISDHKFGHQMSIFFKIINNLNIGDHNFGHQNIDISKNFKIRDHSFGHQIPPITFKLVTTILVTKNVETALINSIS